MSGVLYMVRNRMIEDDFGTELSEESVSEAALPRCGWQAEARSRREQARKYCWRGHASARICKRAQRANEDAAASRQTVRGETVGAPLTFVRRIYGSVSAGPGACVPPGVPQALLSEPSPRLARKHLRSIDPKSVCAAMSREQVPVSEKQALDNASASDPSAPQQEKKTKPDWRTNEQQVLPENNLPLVFFGLMASVFLSALDQVSYTKCAAPSD